MFAQVDTLIADIKTMLEAVDFGVDMKIYRDDLQTFETKDSLPAIQIFALSDEYVGSDADFGFQHLRKVALHIDIRVAGFPVSSVVAPIADKIVKCLRQDNTLDVVSMKVVSLDYMADDTQFDYSSGALKIELEYIYEPE